MTEKQSQTIRVVRVLCIFFMCYVHVNPSPVWTPDLMAAYPTYAQYIYYVIVDILGRGSVPALSLISGYLAVYAYNRRSDYWKYFKSRFASIIVPMMSWNSIIILLSLLIYFATSAQTTVLKEVMPAVLSGDFISTFDKISGHSYGSATDALNFLRDLFAIGLLIPLYFYLFKKTGAFGVFLIWLIGLTLGFAPFVFRPTILMFFTLGFFIAMQSTDQSETRKSIKQVSIAALSALALVYFVPQLNQLYASNTVHSAFLLSVSIPFLLFAVYLSSLNIGASIAKLEPAIYVMFLSHNSFMLILWGAWQVAFGKDVLWPYPIFFIMAPIVTLLISVVLIDLLKYVPTPLQIASAGKKLKR